MQIIKVTLPKHAKVLVLEDSAMRIAWYQDRIPDLTVVKSVPEFKTYFQPRPPCDFMFLDHDLGEPETGEDAVAWFMGEFGGALGQYAIVHSWNRPGAIKMTALMPGSTWIPFGSFELEVDQ